MEANDYEKMKENSIDNDLNIWTIGTVLGCGIIKVVYKIGYFEKQES